MQRVSRLIKRCAQTSTPLAGLGSVPSIGKRFVNSAFVPPPQPQNVGSNTVIGTSSSLSLDLQNATVGQHIDVPYEITLTEADRTFFHSVFYDYDRLTTSNPFSSTLGFPSAPLPLYMLLGHLLSMSHVDSSLDVLDLGFENAVYVNPAFSGDTIHKSFTVKSIRPTQNKANTIVTIKCNLFNQKNQLLVSADKIMLFYGLQTKPGAGGNAAPPSPLPKSHLLSSIIDHSNSLHFPSSRPLSVGQCLLHHISAPLGLDRHLSLLSTYRMSHPRLVNLAKYHPGELLVPGVTVAALAHSTANRALFEVLHETVDSCSLVNTVSPLDSISGITYIQSINDLTDSGLGSPLAQVRAVTVGVKNIDVTRDLAGVSIPLELFDKNLRPGEVESMLDSTCPLLKNKVVVRSSRTLIRQSIYSRQEQTPLL